MFILVFVFGFTIFSKHFLFMTNDNIYFLFFSFSREKQLLRIFVFFFIGLIQYSGTNFFDFIIS